MLRKYFHSFPLIVRSALHVVTRRSFNKCPGSKAAKHYGDTLLIIHCDDLGMAHSINLAAFSAIETRSITSASVMVPCAWFDEVVTYSKVHPEADIGIHLTLTSERRQYRWGPVSPTCLVPSLIDPEGFFWEQPSMVVRYSKPSEVAMELRAQLFKAMSAGLQPTHLDVHQWVLFQDPSFFKIYLDLARQFGLPFRLDHGTLAKNIWMKNALSPERDYVALDSIFSIKRTVAPAEWEHYYSDVITCLPPGVSELIVHLGYDDMELRHLTKDYTDWGAAWRQRDFDIVTSSNFHHVLQECNIALVGWRHLGRHLQH